MSLQSQLMLIEQTLRTGQTSLLPALQDLYVQSHEDAALAWSDLAWLRLRSLTAQPEQSLLEAQNCLEQAIHIRPDCWQALDGLCEVHYKQGHISQAQQYGRASLDVKHVLTLQNAADAQPAAHARRYGHVQSDLRVIAFSLFGRDAFYAEAALRNATDVARWYPDWICRFYVGADVSNAVKRRLVEAGAEVVIPPQAQAHLPGTVWRFMALDDLRVKTALFRDADSLITEREVQAVQQWLSSDRTAHVMRDHLMHTELMLAGLWGAHTQGLRGVGEAMISFFRRSFHVTHADQHFLRDWVWPRVYRSVMQHDDAMHWHAPGMPSPAPFPRSMQAQEEHVGHAPTQWTQLNLPTAFLQRPTVLNVQLLTADGSLLGDYQVMQTEGSYPLRLPPHVMCAVESGQWRLNAILPSDAIPNSGH